MPRVTLYTRPGCGLCDEVKEQIEALRPQVSFDLEECNIDEQPSLRDRYHEHVPVVAVEGEEVSRHRLDRERFLAKLRSLS